MSDVLLQPLTWFWVALILGAVRLGHLGSRRWAVGLGVVAGLLSVLGGTPLSGWLLARLEQPYASGPALAPGSLDVVVVLGGGLSASETELAGFSVDSGYDRPVTGVTLVGRGVATNLVFGGGFRRVGDRVLEAGETQVRWWRDRLPAGVRLEYLPDCRTTRDEAVRLAELARREGWTRIGLVTSGSHLPRAMAAFAGVGLWVVPVGCDLDGLARLEKQPGWTVVPMPGDLKMFERWAHEVVGRVYYRWRGWM